jgi:hypothetical protein
MSLLIFEYVYAQAMINDELRNKLIEEHPEM